ncbi:MAG: phage major capsid protein [Thermoleophilia bacterium]
MARRGAAHHGAFPPFNPWRRWPNRGPPPPTGAAPLIRVGSPRQLPGECSDTEPPAGRPTMQHPQKISDRAELVTAMQRIVDHAEREGRDLTKDEAARWEECDRIVAFMDARSINRLPGPQLTTRDAAWLSGDNRVQDLGAELRMSLFEGTGSGSYLVADQLWAQVWDRLAPQSVAFSAGATVIRTNSDTIHIPRLTADHTATWTAEGASISTSDATVAEIVAHPRKIAALTSLSNELIADASVDVTNFVFNNMARTLALSIDLAFFQGSGVSPEPQGMKGTAGISTVSMGTNGSTPTNLDPIADAIGTLAQSNANATVIVMHPRTWQTLSKLKELPSGSNKPLLQESAGSGGQGIARSIYGIPTLLTSQLSITETQGTSNDSSSIYVYEAAQTVVVMRKEIEVVTDRSRLFHQDMTEVRAISRADFAFPQPAAICRIVGVRP